MRQAILLRLIFPKSFLENTFSLKIILRHRPSFAHFLKTSLLRAPQIFGGGEDGPKRTGGRTDEVEILKNGRVLKDTLFFSCLWWVGKRYKQDRKPQLQKGSANTAGQVGWGSAVFSRPIPPPSASGPPTATHKKKKTYEKS